MKSFIALLPLVAMTACGGGPDFVSEGTINGQTVRCETTVDNFSDTVRTNCFDPNQSNAPVPNVGQTATQTATPSTGSKKMSGSSSAIIAHTLAGLKSDLESALNKRRQQLPPGTDLTKDTLAFRLIEQIAAVGYSIQMWGDQG
jgi:hypothetical protein